MYAREESGSLDVHALIESLLQCGETNLHGKVIDAVERQLIARVLRHTGGHQTRASELLGLNRATLRHKLRALGIGVDRVVTEEGVQEETGQLNHDAPNR
jgi:two-component system nitrogen regulation response regulator GlnG